MTGPSTDYERSRLIALDHYAVLDTEHEAIFDQFAAMTAQLLEAPISIVGMIDQNRHWFKAMHGTKTHSNSRGHSFCTYTVQSDQVFAVENALEDARFATNPSVTGAAQIRSYAGAPLVTKDGLSIGTLCIFDTNPRTFSALERETLSRLAGLVMRELEERLTRINAGNNTPEPREQALDRAASNIGERLGLPVLKLFGAQATLELGALGSEPDVLEGVFSHLKQTQAEVQPNPNLKLKLLERLRFTRNHTVRPAPARVLLIGDSQAVVAHAFEPSVALQVWSKQPGHPPLALNSSEGSAILVSLPADSTLLGLSALSNTIKARSSEPEWLALGEIKR